MKASGVTRSIPDLAPMWWIKIIEVPAKMPPTRPWFARNSAMTFVLNSVIASGAMGFRLGLLGALRRRCAEAVREIDAACCQGFGCHELESLAVRELPDRGVAFPSPCGDGVQ